MMAAKVMAVKVVKALEGAYVYIRVPVFRATLQKATPNKAPPTGMAASKNNV
jgi:hypothetical protein